MFNSTEVERRDVSLLTYGVGTRTYSTVNAPLTLEKHDGMVMTWFTVDGPVSDGESERCGVTQSEKLHRRAEPEEGGPPDLDVLVLNAQQHM